ncbi:hypothetical protein [Pseudorhodoferax sp. Leaf267]|nr:hypothetical protein [Pseudorhodoferax sp. Leaf267]
MTKTVVIALWAMALLTGCPDAKPPKDPTKLPMPTTAPAGEPKSGG